MNRALSLALLSSFALACGSSEPAKGSASPSGSTAAAPPAKSVASVASSAPPPPPPPPPSPADMEKKTWTYEGKTTPLVMTDLTKCFVKDTQLMLPEGTKLTTLMESRGCVARPHGEEGPYIMVVSDEIPTDMPSKEKLAEKMKRLFEETADGFMGEPKEEKPGVPGVIFSRVQRKVGKHQMWCVGQPNKAKPAEEIARGFYKLCQTLGEVPPKK